MRIRKHAKVSPLAYTSPPLQNGAALQSSTICQLNQSPWDVITFSPDTITAAAAAPPPLPPRQVEEEDCFLGNGSFAASIGASESVASMKLSISEDDVAADVEMNDVKSMVEAGKEEEEMFCVKIDGKGWQCHRVAMRGDNLCEHHKSLEHRRRGRPKKGSTSTYPNGYYYYSGFGPRWGKRRGPHNHTQPESPSILEPESEEEEEEEEEEEGGNGKKRARKPIKARSLKSLM